MIRNGYNGVLMKSILFSIVVLFALSAKAQTVKVAAASDMKYLLTKLVAGYKTKYPSASIDVSFGSSGLFYQQISNGAAYDIYFSADISYPEKLKDLGFVNGNVTTYAFGSLVLYSASIDVSKGIDVLKDDAVKKIAIANPQHAPYGKRAVECLKYYKIYDLVKSKLVLGDNITQTAQYTVTGNADVGIIALALALAPEMKSKGGYIILDTKTYNPVEQGCVLIRSRQVNPEASRFLKFVLSHECKPLFEKYGFIVP